MAAALRADGILSSGWMPYHPKAYSLAESAGWVLVTAGPFGQGPLHYAESVHLFLYLSRGSGAVLPSASCVTSYLCIWVPSMWIQHWGWETWVKALSPPLRSWEVLDIGGP